MMRLLRRLGAVVLTLAALPFSVVAALLGAAFAPRERRTATEVAAYLGNFVNGEAGPWDWDDFISVPIADPVLEQIRCRAAAIDLPVSDEGSEVLRRLLCRAEALAALEAQAAMELRPDPQLKG
jgi:hypothetical protein